MVFQGLEETTLGSNQLAAGLQGDARVSWRQMTVFKAYRGAFSHQANAILTFLH